PLHHARALAADSVRAVGGQRERLLQRAGRQSGRNRRRPRHPRRRRPGSRQGHPSEDSRADAPAMTRVKICGITSLEDAMTAVEAGADALGFIFVENTPRFMTPEKVAPI